MSEPGNWSPSFAAWRLFDTLLDAEGRKARDLSRDHILALYAQCMRAVEGHGPATDEETEFASDLLQL